MRESALYDIITDAAVSFHRRENVLYACLSEHEPNHLLRIALTGAKQKKAADDYAAFKQAVAYLDLEVVIGFTVLGADKDAGLQALVALTCPSASMIGMKVRNTRPAPTRSGAYW